MAASVARPLELQLECTNGLRSTCRSGTLLNLAMRFNPTIDDTADLELALRLQRPIVTP